MTWLALVMAMAAWPGVAVADIDNTARATATYGGAPVNSAPVDEAVPVAPATAAMTVTKAADFDNNVPAGQVVTYTYTVTNTGKSTLTAITLSDAHNGSGPAPVPGGEWLSNDGGAPGGSTDNVADDGVWSVLAPGDTVTFKATYTVTQTDVETLQ